ncbi:MAG: hypothetical protein ABI882_09985, partial [Acidobacteriota bacterium]
FLNEKVKMVERWAALSAVLLALLLLGVGVSRLVYPFDVGHFEACIWVPSLMSAEGVNPYGFATREPFAMAPYGYFYYLLIGAGLRAFGWQLWFGRALSILSGGICVLSIKYIVWKVTQNRGAVLLAVLAFLASITLHHWLAVQRPDLPALALAIGALALSFKSRDGSGRIGSRELIVIVMLTLAIFSKQTIVLPVLVIAAFYWQTARPQLALSILVGVFCLSAAIGFALNATSAGGYFQQHFALMSRTPYSCLTAMRWLLSLGKSPATWIALGLFATAIFRNRDNLFPLTRERLKASLHSPYYLLSCYLITSFAFAIFTSAHAGAYINYYLETSIVAAIVVGLAWQSISSMEFRPKFYGTLVSLFLLAGVLEFSRMTRGESYRWRSLPYYQELVETLASKTTPDTLCISAHPELVTAAGRKYHFGDWMPYQDGRSPELHRILENAMRSGRYAAIIWLRPDDPLLDGNKLVPMQKPLPDRHYPLYLFMPERRSTIQ